MYLIAQDKANHFIYGTAVAVVTKLVFPEFAFSGLIAAALIGLAKEAADAVLNNLSSACLSVDD